MNKFKNFLISLGLLVILVVALMVWVKLTWPLVLAAVVLFAEIGRAHV